MDYDDHLSQLFRTTIGLLSLEDETVLNAAWDCINSIVKVLYGSCAISLRMRYCQQIVGHVNIGIVFLFIGNLLDAYTNTQSILTGCSTLSQEYCKLIGLYWKLMRRQL